MYLMSNPDVWGRRNRRYLRPLMRRATFIPRELLDTSLSLSLFSLFFYFYLFSPILSLRPLLLLLLLLPSFSPFGIVDLTNTYTHILLAIWPCPAQSPARLIHLGCCARADGSPSVRQEGTHRSNQTTITTPSAPSKCSFMCVLFIYIYGYIYTNYVKCQTTLFKSK